MSQFIQDYCVSPGWAELSASPDNPFSRLAFGDKTPCFSDGVILSTCYVSIILIMAIRLGQVSGHKDGQRRFKDRCYPMFRALLVWCIFFLEVFNIAKFASPSLVDKVGTIYATPTLVPFEAVSGGLACLAWLVAAIALSLEPNRFTLSGTWMENFSFLFCLLCLVVKIYVIQTLFPLGVNVLDDATTMQGPSVWFFYAYVFITMILALGPIFRSYHEDDLEPQVQKPGAGRMGGLQDPLLTSNVDFKQTFHFDSSIVIEGDADESGGDPILSAAAAAGTFPEERTNIFSRLLFLWLFPLMFKGYKRPLEFKDVWQLNDGDRTDTVLAAFDVAWAKERQKESPSLARAIWITWKFKIILGGFLFAMNIASSLCIPVFISQFAKYFSNPDSTNFEGYMLAVSFFLAQLVFSIGASQYSLLMGRVGMRLRSAMLSKVFEKSLCLAPEAAALPKYSVGKLNNLMTSDTSTMQMFMSFGHSLWSNPIQIIIALSLLYGQLGWIAFLTIAVMVSAVPITKILSQKMMMSFMSIKMFQDKRLSALNEGLNSINVVKFYSWESSVIEGVMNARADELGMRWKASVYQAWFGFIASGVPIVIALVAFGTLAAVYPDRVTAGVLFTSLAYFDALRMPLAMLPFSITMLQRVRVCMDRVQDFLLAKERAPLPTPPTTPSENPIKIEKASFHWFVYESKNGKDEHTVSWSLKNVDMDVKKGELVAVVGKTASGKTSLLSALSSDMPISSGTSVVDATMAVVPQEAWIFNATVRENVLFGKPFDEQRYNEAVRVSCLEEDFAKMDYGDKTEIGAKGVNLSGGQKQRVSIARAVYSDAQVYLLDDCLSALDAHVAREVFEQCLVGYLRNRGKTVIFATNRVEFVSDCDKILVMEDGEITAQGPVEQVEEESSEFRAIMAQIGGSKHSVHEDSEAEKVVKEEKSKATAEKARAKSTIKAGAGATLTQAETRVTGSVAAGVLMAYVDAIGGKLVGIGFTGQLVLTQVVSSMISLFLTEWGKASDTDAKRFKWFRTFTPGDFIAVYAGIQVFQLALALVISFYSKYLSVRGSHNLHNDMVSSVFRAPMSFFNSNPLGRITNRFSKDIADVDMNTLPNIQKLMQSIFSLIGALILMCSTTIYTTAIVVPVFFLFFGLARFFQTSNLEVKRLDSLSRGPIFSHFSECVTGIASIRTYRAEVHELAKSGVRVDVHISLDLLQLCLNQWLSIVLTMLGSTLVLGCTVFGVAGRVVLGPGLAIMAIQTSTSISPVMSNMLSNYAVAEQGLNAVERVDEYSNLEAEKFTAGPKCPQPPADWPKKGVIRWENAVASYRKDLDPILRGLDVTIQDGEKVGIVGRTGAGKSTLFLTLFRLLELDSGRAEIDGIDISKIDLEKLRGVLSIIPQEPVLFSGTLRYNLDPYDRYSTAQLWDVLEKAHLAEYVRKQAPGLEMIVVSGGANFSAGQRQLVCLARALLLNSKILILDEATASVDVGTDALIQETIRTVFGHCTVLAIAHRLNTIIDSDKILVLDQGRAEEFDTPGNLLKDPNSIFSSMIDETGKENASIMRRVAFGELDISTAMSVFAAEQHAESEANVEVTEVTLEGGGQPKNSSSTVTQRRGSAMLAKKKRTADLWKTASLLARKRVIDKKLGLMDEKEEKTTPLDPTKCILDLRTSLANILAAEEKLSQMGKVDMHFLSQFSQAASDLNSRVQQRILDMTTSVDGLAGRNENSAQMAARAH